MGGLWWPPAGLTRSPLTAGHAKTPWRNGTSAFHDRRVRVEHARRDVDVVLVEIQLGDEILVAGIEHDQQQVAGQRQVDQAQDRQDRRVRRADRVGEPHAADADGAVEREADGSPSAIEH